MEDIKEYFQIEKTLQNHQKENLCLTIQNKQDELKITTSKISSLESSIGEAFDKDQQKWKDGSYGVLADTEAQNQEFDRQVMVEVKKELESFLEKKKRLISDLECMSNQYAVIESMHSRQDEILRRMFDGNYGSAEENCLEQKLDQLELQQGIIQEAHFRWSQAALLVECGHGQLVEAVSLWSRLGEAAQDHQARLGLGARTRSNLVAAMQNLTCAEQYLAGVAMPYCSAQEMETLRTAASYIFHDMQTQRRHQHALDCYSVTQTRSAALLKWIKIVISETINKDFKEISDSVRRVSEELRNERIRLMKEIAEKENVGGSMDLFFDVNLTINVEEANHQPAPDPDTTQEVYSATDLDDGIKLPSKEEIFGRVHEITAQYQDENEKIMQQIKDHQEKIGSKLQNQLAARRQRRAMKNLEEKQISALTNI